MSEEYFILKHEELTLFQQQHFSKNSLQRLGQLESIIGNITVNCLWLSYTFWRHLDAQGGRDLAQIFRVIIQYTQNTIPRLVFCARRTWLALRSEVTCRKFSDNCYPACSRMACFPEITPLDLGSILEGSIVRLFPNPICASRMHMHMPAIQLVAVQQVHG